MKLRGLSLFANVGIAEAYLKGSGTDILLANEIDPKRAKFYRHLYPETELIEGDVTKKEVFDLIVKKSKEKRIDFIMATPPCQGMSMAGKKDALDPRNKLICYAVELIKKIKPNFVLLENVPQQLKTLIDYKGQPLLIPDYIKYELEKTYFFNKQPKVNAADYGVPQRRERSIFLLSNKKTGIVWEFPEKDTAVVTLKDAIGDIPPLDPFIYDLPTKKHLSLFPDYEKKLRMAQAISKWHIPPKHINRQVQIMRYTPTGQSAFNNPDFKHRPCTAHGAPVKGFKNTYKRQSWDKPAYTVTMYNRTIGSQENVHPGRPMGLDKTGYMVYSDPRVLTVHELIIVMSLPKNWNIPDGVSEHFIRQVIGEGIPPLLVKKTVHHLKCASA